MIIGIIGGGASGMAAALAAAQDPENQVILFERQARVGRKLQATGNGRCNLTNLHAGVQGYHGQDPDFSGYAIGRFDPEKTLSWFRELGLFTVEEPSGRVYPYSDQANSVVDVLRFALEKPNITLKTAFEVEKIKKETDYSEGGIRKVDKMIDKMLEEGLLEEVTSLKNKGYTKDMVSMQGLGYKEILDYLNGECSLEEAIYILKRDTRHFAKRQLTWFRRERDVIWIDKNEYDHDEEKVLETILSYVKERINITC